MSEHLKSHSDDQELIIVPQHIIKSIRTSLFENLSTETSDNQDLAPQQIIKSKRTSLFENLSTEARKQIEYTKDQCQGKFKYLFLCYKKKLDNRHETGSAVYDFEFFNELDELFGRKPNIKPKHLASSSHVDNGLKESDGIFNEDNVASPSRSTNTPPEAKKQKKKSIVHEAAIQKRHDEKMAISQLAIDTYQKYMDKILEKL